MPHIPNAFLFPGVLRHLQTTSHVGRYEELIAILKDVGCKKSFSKDSWKYRRELSFEDLFADDIGADHNSSISSILNYPNSRDADLVSLVTIFSCILFICIL